MKNYLTKHLYSRMAEAVYPAGIEGLCQLQLVDEGEIFFCNLDCRNGGIGYSEGSVPHSDAVVRMGYDTLAYILSTTDRFDLRNPEILAKVGVEGDIDLVGFLFSLVKRPSERIERLIKETEKNTFGYKDKVREIDRVCRPDRETVMRLMSRSIPFVITGAIDDCPLLWKTLEEIKSEFGEVILRPDMEKGDGKNETFGDFISRMENNRNEQVYTFGCPLPLDLWVQLPLPFFDWEHLTTPQIWMGKKTGDRPCTNLHRDCAHGMLANIFGRKRLVLFSPDQSESLAPIRAFNTFQPCQVKDVHRVDIERFPLFRNAKPLEVTIGAGEILVIPALWYHCVFALDDVFSVSFGLLWDAWDTMNAPAPALESF
ncbi:MAG TPA: cupin-like domain-containing protein [Puia sp.]|jgi:hypothetical protein|nr:cupin-like domain-containing protein [Puia sp.]